MAWGVKCVCGFRLRSSYIWGDWTGLDKAFGMEKFR
jgi:hypothetical protein